MSKPPVFVDSDSDVKDVISAMKGLSVPCTIIDENKKAVGLISELDLLELIHRHLEKDDTFIQITGLEDHDPYTFHEMNELINRHLNKINKMKKTQSIKVHISHHHHEKDLSKYTLHGRLSIPKHSYSSQVYDWDLIVALDKLMQSFEKQVRKDHDKNSRKRRRSKK